MAEDAGSIYSEVRIRLDKLQADINQAVTNINSFGNKVVDMGNVASNLFSNNYAESIRKVSTYIKSLDAAVASGAVTQKQAIQLQIEARKQELAYIQATAAKKGGYTDQEIADLKATQAELTRLGVSYNQVGTSSQGAAQKSQASGAAILAVSVAIGAAFRGLITTFASFEQSMANVQAVTNASASEFLLLKDAAEEAGATTRFSASEAADALYYLGSAGFSATQSVDALDGVLLLAQATGSDLASTSDTLAAAISQYGLAASDATRISNLFAAANAGSQANMEKLQASFRQVGPVAGSLGVSIEQTTASLMALYNAGFQGEAAGTALRSILLDLSSSSSTVSKDLAALGVTLMDEQGNFVGLTEAIEILADSGVNLGEVFGKETAAQMLVLAEASRNTEGDLRDLEASITGTNAAATAAAIQTNTLAGSFDEFSSAGENAGNKVVEAITPALRGLLDAGSAVLGFFAEAPAFIQGVVGSLGTLAVGFGVAQAAASLFGTSLIAALGPVGLIVTGVVAGVIALGVGISSSMAEANQATTRLIANNEKLISTYASNRRAVDELFKGQKSLNDSSKLTSDQINKLKELYPGLSSVIDLNTASVKDARKALADYNKEQLQSNLATINTQIQEQTKRVQELNDRITGRAGQVRGRTQEAIKGWQDEGRAIIANINSLKEQQKELTSELDGSKAAAEQRAAQTERDKELARQRTEAATAEANAKKVLAAENAKLLEEQLAKVRTASLGEIAALEEKKNEELRIAKERGASALQLSEITAFYEGEIQAVKQKTVDQLDEQLQRIRNASASEIDILKQRLAEELQVAEERGASAEQLAEIRAFYEQKVLDAQKDSQNEALYETINYLSNIKSEYQNYSGTVLSIFSDIASAVQTFSELAIESIDAELEARLEAIDTELEAKLEAYEAENEALDENLELAQERIDAETQAKLEAEGVAEETTIQRLQRELEEAKATGDAETILEAEKALRRQQIIDEGEAAKQAAEAETLAQQEANTAAAAAAEAAAIAEETRLTEEAERKKAKAQYEGEMVAWGFKLASAIAAAPVAIINAMQTGYGAGFPVGLVLGPALGIAAGAAAGVQIAAVAASKPQAPNFATGGIVLPQGSAGTQVTVADQGGGEIMFGTGALGNPLMEGFGDSIAAKVLAGNQVRPMVINITMQGKLVAQTVANYVNNGQVEIKLS